MLLLFKWIRKIFDFTLKLAGHLIFNQQLRMMNDVLFPSTKLLLLRLLRNGLNSFAKIEKRLTTKHNLEGLLLRPHLKILKKYKYITTEELQEQTDFSHGTIQRIISDHLNLSTTIVLYVLKQLTDFQRVELLQVCQENLSKFESGA